MRRLLLACLLSVVGSTAVHAIDKEVAFADPAMNERYLNLIREIRCPLCQNESIADSNAPVAADLRREIRRLMSEGSSDDQIKDFLSARYGDFVLYRPRVDPTTWALWAGPFLFLAIGGLAFWRILKARRAQPIDDEDLAT